MSLKVVYLTCIIKSDERTTTENDPYDRQMLGDLSTLDDYEDEYDFEAVNRHRNSDSQPKQQKTTDQETEKESGNYHSETNCLN